MLEVKVEMNGQITHYRKGSISSLMLYLPEKFNASGSSVLLFQGKGYF